MPMGGPGGGPPGGGQMFFVFLSQLIQMGGIVFICYVFWRALLAFEKFVERGEKKE